MMAPTLPHAARSDLWVPPEEDPHDGTLMQWPNNRRVYSDAGFLDDVQKSILEIANTIAAFEPVFLLAPAETHTEIAPRISMNVALWPIATDDLWCRDSGPLFAFDQAGNRVVSHIQFNGWGRKQTHKNDGRVSARVAERMGATVVPSGLRGEAGGVDHDGHGKLIAHESSWIIDNRNPDMTRTEIEERLLAAYGADEMIWSPGVRGLDITDYHIDSLARFTGAGRGLINLPKHPDKRDPFHRAAHETHSALMANGLEIEIIPEPEMRRVESNDFVASYVNYYACNNAVVAPQFGDKSSDEIAQDALSRHYPGREIVMLNTDVLGEIGGGIHCATQQIPAMRS